MSTKILNINIFSFLVLICFSIFLSGCFLTDKDNKKVEPQKTTEVKVENTKEVATTQKIGANETNSVDNKNTNPVKNVNLSQELVVSIYYASFSYTTISY